MTEDESEVVEEMGEILEVEVRVWFGEILRGVIDWEIDEIEKDRKS